MSIYQKLIKRTEHPAYDLIDLAPKKHPRTTLTLSQAIAFKLDINLHLTIN